MSEKKHMEKIVDQFSKQAIPFTKIQGHFDSMDLLVKFSKVNESDNVLDVACGPGIVACEFAKYSEHVTGIDITPEMIKTARKNQEGKSLSNINWDIGDACPLPYDNDIFSLVITRYSFHHFENVKAALSEMIRVCKPGGRVLVADVGIEPEKSEAYDRLEIMRDPSHTHALTTVEFDELFSQSGLENCSQSGYGVDIELEAQLKASFPKEEDIPKLREMVTGDIGINDLGINAKNRGGDVVYTVPISLFMGYKA